MRSKRPAAALLFLLLLAGCATSPDPAQGGFISGVNGLLSGGYDQRIAAQSAELERMRIQQAAAEAEASQAQAALQERQQSLAALRNDVARLDRSLQQVQAKAAQQAMQNAALSNKDLLLRSGLQAAKARLATLQEQLRSGAPADNYDSVRQEYLNLQTTIAALNEQLKESSR